MAAMNSISAASASGQPCTAARTCSYVQPLGPAADPRSTTLSTRNQMWGMTVTDNLVTAGNRDKSSCGWRRWRVLRISSAGLTSHPTRITLAAQEMLPSWSWRWMRHCCHVPFVYSTAVWAGVRGIIVGWMPLKGLAHLV
jgi:hypothetical protein